MSISQSLYMTNNSSLPFSALLHESRTSMVSTFAKMSASVGQEQYPIRATRKSRNWLMSPKWVQVSHKYHKKVMETGLYRQNGSNCKSMSVSYEDREKLEETGQYR